MPIKQAFPLISSVLSYYYDERNYLYWVNAVPYMETPISFTEYKMKLGIPCKQSKKHKINEATKKAMREDARSILNSISSSDKIL